jgi:hypothetical protein
MLPVVSLSALCKSLNSSAADLCSSRQLFSEAQKECLEDTESS